MSERKVVVRPGKHFGWWVDGRSGRGRRFMLTWWPAKGLALFVSRLLAAHASVRVED